MKKIFFIFISIFILTSCYKGDRKVLEFKTTEKSYYLITAAKFLEMTQELKYLIIDNRDEESYVQSHIKDSINYSFDPDASEEIKNEIIETFMKEFPNKKMLIFTYCYRGLRSGEFSKYLALKGYSNLYNFGGIVNFLIAMPMVTD